MPQSALLIMGSVPPLFARFPFLGTTKTDTCLSLGHLLHLLNLLTLFGKSKRLWQSGIGVIFAGNFWVISHLIDGELSCQSFQFHVAYQVRYIFLHMTLWDSNPFHFRAAVLQQTITSCLPSILPSTLIFFRILLRFSWLFCNDIVIVTSSQFDRLPHAPIAYCDTTINRMRSILQTACLPQVDCQHRGTRGIYSPMLWLK